MLNTLLPRLFLACACLLPLAGCGGSRPVTVSGKVILPAGVKMGEGDTGNILFAPEEQSGKPSTANFSKELTFETKDIRPGKYKVVVRIDQYMGAKGNEKRARDYQMVNKAFDDKASKLTLEVAQEPAQQSVTIDLPGGSVRK
jgi:hypothetical protein